MYIIDFLNYIKIFIKVITKNFIKANVSLFFISNSDYDVIDLYRKVYKDIFKFILLFETLHLF